MTDTPNALEPVLKFLLQYEPYRSMLPTHQEYLALYLEQVFFAENDVILAPEDDDEPNSLYIIKSGHVCGANCKPEISLGPGDCFPVIALVENHVVSAKLIAQKSTICYRLKQPHFDYLVKQSHVFHNYCIEKQAQK